MTKPNRFIYQDIFKNLRYGINCVSRARILE